MILWGKRLGTALALFIPIFILAGFFGLGILSSLVGAAAMAGDPSVTGDIQADYRTDREAMQRAEIAVRKKYGFVVCGSAAGVSGTIALAFAFSGVLPWCRRQSGPPPLSGAGGRRVSKN